MHINFFHQDNIHCKALAVLFKNRGFKIKSVSLNSTSTKNKGFLCDRESDIILIDVKLSNKFKISEALKSTLRHQKIILLGPLRYLYLLERIQNKAKGFISSHILLDDAMYLLKTVRAENFMLGNYTKDFLHKHKLEKQNTLFSKKLDSALTKTELKIMGKISLGKSSKKIAKEYHRSIHTIRNHRKNIKSKFYDSASLKLKKFCALNKNAIETMLFIENI